MKEPTVESLLAERATLIARIRDIDESLGTFGIMAVGRAPSGSRVADMVIALIGSGLCTAPEIRGRTGQAPDALYVMLHRLAIAGRIKRVRNGVYALPVAA